MAPAKEEEGSGAFCRHKRYRHEPSLRLHSPSFASNQIYAETYEPHGVFTLSNRVFPRALKKHCVKPLHHWIWKVQGPSRKAEIDEKGEERAAAAERDRGKLHSAIDVD